jgi:porin
VTGLGDVTRRSALISALTMLGTLATPAVAQSGASDAGTSPALSTSFSYAGVIQANVGGGTRRGAAYDGALAIQLTFPLDRLMAWSGAQLFLFALDTHGGKPSDPVGALQPVNPNEAPPGLRVEELWLQKNLLENRLSLLAGRYDINTEFYRLQSAALFVNSSFGIGPEFAQSGVAGPSTFPFTAVGARADFKPSANIVWRAALLNGSPVDRPGGGVHLFARGDGALLLGEVAALKRPDTAKMPRDRRFEIGRGMVRPYVGKVALGVWHYTASFPDLVDTLTTGIPVARRGSTGGYIVADQSIWSAAKGARTLAAFTQLGIGDSRVNSVGRYLGAGLTLSDPLPRREQDQFGFAIAAAFLSSHYKAATVAPSASAETALELTYLAQFTQSIVVQLDMQYVVHPGAVQSRRSSLVPGLRLALSR